MYCICKVLCTPKTHLVCSDMSHFWDTACTIFFLREHLAISLIQTDTRSFFVSNAFYFILPCLVFHLQYLHQCHCLTSTFWSWVRKPKYHDTKKHWHSFINTSLSFCLNCSRFIPNIFNLLMSETKTNFCDNNRTQSEQKCNSRNENAHLLTIVTV